MPCLNLSTNVNLDSVDSSSILSEATSIVAKLIRKPEAVLKSPVSSLRRSKDFRVIRLLSVLEKLKSKIAIAFISRVKVQYFAKLLTLKRVVIYVLELAECDLNYHIRDRARFLKNIISCNLGTPSVEEEANSSEQHKKLSSLVTQHIFCGQTKPLSFQPNKYRFYLPGSLSQIVLHAAPGYEPLPKPCSLPCVDPGTLEKGGSNGDLNASDNPDSVSGSLPIHLGQLRITGWRSNG